MDASSSSNGKCNFGGAIGLLFCTVSFERLAYQKTTSPAVDCNRSKLWKENFRNSCKLEDEIGTPVPFYGHAFSQYIDALLL